MGCNEFKKLERHVRAAAPEQQWNAWAAKMNNRCTERTNAGEGSIQLRESELPEFVRRVPAACIEWQVSVICGNSASNTFIQLISLGGFGSFGLDVGTPAYKRAEDAYCKKVFPGVYVRRIPSLSTRQESF